MKWTESKMLKDQSFIAAFKTDCHLLGLNRSTDKVLQLVQIIVPPGSMYAKDLPAKQNRLSCFLLLSLLALL